MASSSSVPVWMTSMFARRDDHDYQELPLSNSDVDSTRQSPRHSQDDFSEKYVPETRSRFAWLWNLAPFFITAPLGKTDRELPKANSTVYLNGIRALACWIVLNDHSIQESYRFQLLPAFGNTKPDFMTTYAFPSLPFVRVLYSGKGMVNIFFVLSGFVLSYSTMRRIHSNSPDKEKTSDEILTSISSSALRRGIRLWGPMFVLSIFTAFMIWFFPYRTDPTLPPSFATHLMDFWHEICRVTNPFDWIARHQTPHWFEQCWTLGAEYRLSMVLFLVILVTSKLTTGARKSVALIISAWSVYNGRRWDVFCIMGGMVLAEFRFAPLSDDVARLLRRKSITVPERLQTVLFVIMFIAGIFFVSFPEHAPEENYPYKIFAPITPDSWLHPGPDHEELGGAWLWYYASFGAIMFIYSLENLPSLQRILSTKVFIYFGEISFSFYLMAEFTRRRIGEPLAFSLMDDYGWPKFSAWCAEYLAAQCMAILIGDYFWRIVDVNCVKLGQLLVGDYLGIGSKSKPQPPRLPETAQHVL